MKNKKSYTLSEQCLRMNHSEKSFKCPCVMYLYSLSSYPVLGSL
uniref:Uncharacterized protein n=1 Tax=Anguilla anguilla TaxID=7936 RepID=A0A0E9SN04_ANGAN